MRPRPAWQAKLESWRRAFERRLPARIRVRVERVRLRVALNLALRRSIGRYLPAWRRRPHTIFLTPFLSETEAWETFGHELAHFVERIVWPPRPGDLHHGERWCEVMAHFALPPQADHNLSIPHRRERWFNRRGGLKA